MPITLDSLSFIGLSSSPRLTMSRLMAGSRTARPRAGFPAGNGSPFPGSIRDHACGAVANPVDFAAVAPVAQLDRVLRFERSGRRFESVRARQKSTDESLAERMPPLAPGSSEKLGAENAVIRAATRAIFTQSHKTIQGVIEPDMMSIVGPDCSLGHGIKPARVQEAGGLV
jgi:hypothetical protein